MSNPRNIQPTKFRLQFISFSIENHLNLMVKIPKLQDIHMQGVYLVRNSGNAPLPDAILLCSNSS